MSEPPVTATPTTTLRAAAKILLEHKIGCLPILDGATLVGIFTTGDFVRLAAR
jgi:CBS domain-containing protein